MIQEISAWRALRLLLGDWRLLKRGLDLIWHGAVHFFAPQFQTLLRPGLRPVVSLSHPLDGEIPFRPRLIATYLGYIGFYLKTLRCLYERFGRAVLPDIRRSLDEVCLLYREAGEIYRRCQSTTTNRPPLPRRPLFVLIYLFDPHLHCIPSLHILLVGYNQHFTSRTLRRLGARGPADLAILEEVDEEARRITETVLLVRQHSVLDIGPSLFLLSSLFPGYGRIEVERLLSGLFTGWDIEEGVKKRLRELLLGSYAELSEEKTGHRETLLRFLARFAPGDHRLLQQQSP